VTTRPYRPSNGTEGEIFDDRWCSNCERDRAWRADESKGEPCDILGRTLIHNVGEPDYPVEWIEDNVPYPQPTNPRCTAFEPITNDPELYAAQTDPRQMALLL
jgi:hypothetical protein